VQYFTVVFVAFIIILLIREFVAYKKQLVLKYITTPLVTFTIILMCLLAIKLHGFYFYSFMIMLGLLCSLIADTLLMIEEVSLFLQGLIYFLIAHVLYVTAFSTGYDFALWNVILAPALLAGALLYYRAIWKARGRHYTPALVYIIILASMLYFAVTSLNCGIHPRGILLATGAMLFVLSDMLLGYNTFIKTIPHSTVFTWSLYAPAQMFIAISCFY